MEPRDPILPCLDFLLSLEGLPGYEKKLKTLRDNAVDHPTCAEGQVQWASLCAELGAIYLLGRSLGLKITGFDQASPRAPRKDCDIRALLNGRPCFFEVKRASKDDTASALPRDLTAYLRTLNYGVDVELYQRPLRFDGRELAALERRVDRHLAEQTHLDRPQPLHTEKLALKFFPEWPGTVSTGWSPYYVRDIRDWLFCTDRLGRDGQPMIPQIQQARAKGADFLMCRVPSWDPLEELIERLYGDSDADLQRETDVGYLVQDPRLDGLRGLVLFNRYDRFRILNSAASDPADRLRPVQG
jgi:hypothetical protein